MASAPHTRFEVWSCDAVGRPHMHGTAAGRTFADACKQLACDSMDFWTHFDKGCYQGRPLHSSRAEALAAHAGQEG